MQKAGALTTRPGVSAASARSPCSTTGPTSARCSAARPPRWPASQTPTATRRTPYAASPAPRRRRAGLLHRQGRPAPACRPHPAGAAGRARAGRSCAAAAAPLARVQSPARGCRERFRAAHAPRSEQPCPPLARHSLDVGAQGRQHRVPSCSLVELTAGGRCLTLAAPSDAAELASGAVPPGTGDSSGRDVLSPASDSSVGDPVSACAAGNTRAGDILVRRTALEVIMHCLPLVPSHSLVEPRLSQTYQKRASSCNRLPGSAAAPLRQLVHT